MNLSVEKLSIPLSRFNAPTPLLFEDKAERPLWYLGDKDLLNTSPIALFCSVKCPGSLILKIYDLARDLRDSGVAVISGFHSPMEKECLEFLLRGKQPVIWCRASRLTAHGMATVYANAIREGRLLLISPFSAKETRATATTVMLRNECVITLADKVFIAHASSGGQTESLARKITSWGKMVLTFSDQSNALLMALGALPCEDVASLRKKAGNGLNLGTLKKMIG